MGLPNRRFPFNAEQTVNILGEFGPLAAMFIVNAAIDIQAGTWALIIATGVALVMMLVVLRRLPVFPFIAGTVTIAFGAMTIATKDPMWIQIKVTIFNILFAAILWIGLWFGKNFFRFIFHQTFHYSEEGWRKFTNNFAWFFLGTAVANEVVRLGFSTDVWINFKLFCVMPAAGLFAWWQTKLMHPHRIDPPAEPVPLVGSAGRPGADGFEFRRADLTKSKVSPKGAL